MSTSIAASSVNRGPTPISGIQLLGSSDVEPGMPESSSSSTLKGQPFDADERDMREHEHKRERTDKSSPKRRSWSTAFAPQVSTLQTLKADMERIKDTLQRIEDNLNTMLLTMEIRRAKENNRLSVRYGEPLHFVASQYPQERPASSSGTPLGIDSIADVATMSPATLRAWLIFYGKETDGKSVVKMRGLLAKELGLSWNSRV